MVITPMLKNKWLLLLFLLFGATALRAQTREEGIKALDAENYATAQRIFTQLIRQTPSDHLNYYYLGIDYCVQSKIDSAKIIFNQGIQADPKSYYNYVGMGRAYLEENNKQKAMENFDKAKSLTTQKDVNLLMILGDAYTSAAHPDYAQALTFLNKAVELTNKNPEVYYVLGKTYEAMPNKSGDAVSAYERSTELDPKMAKSYTRLGVIWRNAMKGQFSSDNFQKAIDADPNFAPAYREWGELYAATGQYEKANSMYEKYLAMADKDCETEFRHAQFLFLTKKYQDARNKLEGLDCNTEKAVYWRLLSYSEYEGGDYEHALQGLKTFFNKIDSQKVLASDYEYLGLAQIKAGDDSTGAINLAKAIGKDSSKFELFNTLGKMYYDQKRYPEAADFYQKKIDAAPKDAQLVDYFNVGRSYYLSGQTIHQTDLAQARMYYAKADSAFTQVIKWNPAWPIGYQWRARSNYAMDSPNPDSVKGLAAPYYHQLIEKATSDPAKYSKELYEAYKYVGDINAIRENYGAAIYYYDQAMAINPTATDVKETYDAVKAQYKQVPGGTIPTAKTDTGYTVQAIINGNNVTCLYMPGITGIAVTEQGKAQVIGSESNGNQIALVKIGEHSVKSVPVTVMSELPHPVAIGADVLNKMNMVFDYASGSLLQK